MKNLKQKLKNNELTIGSWISIGHQDIAEIMTQCGFEWLVLDLEHTCMDFSIAKTLISTIKATNQCTPLVRVGANDELIIKRVLDSGAEGVIVPMVKSAEDAQKAVNHVYYPPIGKRGVGLYAAQNYGVGFESYLQWLKESVVIIAQIEHIEAVNNLESILDTQGIDGIIVGPYDLSASMGHPGEYERIEVKKALETVIQICKKKNKSLGFHVIKSEAKYIEEKISEGYNFLAFSLDFFFLGDRIREEMNKLKNHLR